MLEKVRGRSHCKYIVGDLSLREWCLDKGYSYNKALKLMKEGTSINAMEIILKKNYMKNKNSINNAAKILQARWHKAASLHNTKELQNIRSEFAADYGDHPRYELLWDYIVMGTSIVVEEEWKVLPWATNYECSDKGRIRKRLKDGNFRILHSYAKHRLDKDNHYKARKYLCVKIGKIEQPLARLVAILFVPRTADKNVVYIKDNKYKHIYADNLEWVTSEECGQRTGYSPSRSRPVVELDNKGNVIKEFRSARDAGKKLFLSYQTVLDYCNGKVKNPICNLRFKEV